jgi:outer membrane protein assembly factor BamB
MLAGKSLLALPLSDGTVRCYEDFEKLAGDKHPEPRWTATLDAKEVVRREAPAAGIFERRGQLCVLGGGGELAKLDPLSGAKMDSVQFQTMSPHSVFSTAPNDGLAALVQRNGRVIVLDLDQKLDANSTLWELPARQGMEESVSVLIDESGVYVATRKDEGGELRKYKRRCDPGSSAPALLWNITLDGHCETDLEKGKNLYLITHSNKVFAYTLNDGRKVWEHKVESDQGEAVAVRAVGENVLVTTNKGKAIVLKAD